MEYERELDLPREGSKCCRSLEDSVLKGSEERWQSWRKRGSRKVLLVTENLSEGEGWRVSKWRDQCGRQEAEPEWGGTEVWRLPLSTSYK